VQLTTAEPFRETGLASRGSAAAGRLVALDVLRGLNMASKP
jgi:hypothetical protein